MALLRSRYLRVITHPAFTIPLFIATPYGLYFTSLFDILMRHPLGHFVMMAHFLAVGLVFSRPIMGVDPGPHRPGHVMRILESFMGMPFHTFFGIALMMAGQPMVGVFEHLMASLGIDPLGDQHAAGGIAWAFREIPSVVVLIALVFQWHVSEQRVSRRKDRAAYRDGVQELAAHNAYLASLNGHASHGEGRAGALPCGAVRTRWLCGRRRVAAATWPDGGLDGGVGPGKGEAGSVRGWSGAGPGRLGRRADITFDSPGA